MVENVDLEVNGLLLRIESMSWSWLGNSADLWSGTTWMLAIGWRIREVWNRSRLQVLDTELWAKMPTSQVICENPSTCEGRFPICPLTSAVWAKTNGRKAVPVLPRCGANGSRTKAGSTLKSVSKPAAGSDTHWRMPSVWGNSWETPTRPLVDPPACWDLPTTTTTSKATVAMGPTKSLASDLIKMTACAPCSTPTAVRGWNMPRDVEASQVMGWISFLDEFVEISLL